jgi:hypothetical protein
MVTHWRASVAHLGPAIVAQATALEPRVPPDVFEAVLDLLAATEEHLSARWAVELEGRWQQVVAHAPGLAPVLALLHDHLDAPQYGPQHRGCEYLAERRPS